MKVIKVVKCEDAALYRATCSEGETILKTLKRKRFSEKNLTMLEKIFGIKTERSTENHLPRQPRIIIDTPYLIGFYDYEDSLWKGWFKDEKTGERISEVIIAKRKNQLLDNFYKAKINSNLQ